MRLIFKLFIYDYVTYCEALEEPILWKDLGGQCILKTQTSALEIAVLCFDDSNNLVSMKPFYLVTERAIPNSFHVELKRSQFTLCEKQAVP